MNMEHENGFEIAAVVGEHTKELIRKGSQKELFYYFGGELEEDHPASRYLREVFREAVGEEKASQYHLSILKEMNQVNAVCYGRNRIAVGTGLLRWVESKEELQATLLHEFVHSEEGHAENYEEIGWDGILRHIAKKRINEYEADMKAAFTEMGKRGLNSYGAVRFLDRLKSHQEEWSAMGIEQSIDLAHGALQDRSLNIETGLHFSDSKGISKQLTPVPGILHETPIYNDYIKFRIGPSVDSPFAEKRQFLTWATYFAEDIPVDKINLAINDINSITNPGYPEDAKKAVLDILVNRLNTEILQDQTADSQFLFFKTICLEFFCGLPYTLNETTGQRGPSIGSKGGVNSRVSIIRQNAKRDRGPQDYLDYLRLVGEAMDAFNVPEALLPLPSTNLAADRIATALYEDMVNRYSKNPPPNIIETYKRSAERFDEKYRSFHERYGAGRAPTDPTAFRFRARLDEFNKQQTTNNLNSRERANKIVDEYRSEHKIAKRADEEAEKSEYDLDFGDDDGPSLDAEDIDEFMKKKIASNTPPESQKKYSEFLDVQGKGISKTKLDRFYNEQVDGKDFVEQAKALRDLLVKIATATAEFAVKNPQVVDVGSDYHSAKIDLVLNHANLFFLPYLCRIIHDRYGGDSSEGKILLIRLCNDFAYSCQVTGGDRGRRGYFHEDFEGSMKFIQSEHPDDSIEELVSESNLELLSSCVSEVSSIETNNINELYAWYDRTMDKNLTSYELPNVFAVIASNFIRNNCRDVEQVCQLLNRLEKKGIKIKQILKKYRNQFAYALAPVWEHLASPLAKKNAEALIELVPYVYDPFLSRKLKAIATVTMLEGESPVSKVTKLFKDENCLDGQVLKDILEDEITTKKDFAQVRSKIGNKIEKALDNPSDEAGWATIFSTMHLSPEDYLEFLNLMLDTSSGDRRLLGFISKFVSKKEKLSSYIDDNYDLDEDDPEEDGYLTDPRTLLQNLYNLDKIGRHFLLRKILTGRGGLIENRDQRKEVLTSIVSRLTNDGEPSAINKVIEDVTLGLSSIEEWKPLFFAVVPLLSDHILVPPETRAERQGSKDQTSSEAALVDPYNHSLYWRRKSERNLSVALNRIGREDYKETDSEKISSLQFVIEVAQHAGAVGVRFLQLLPQFVDLTEAERIEFGRVYDDVYGQNKLNAVNVLEREWPAIWREISHIQKRIGGGSLMTAYLTTNKKEEQEVIKVLNPNTSFHVDNTEEFVAKVIDKLEAGNPEGYKQSSLVLQEVVEWIKRDISFKGFLEQDERFRAHDGFRPDGFNYKIKIPQSRGPANPYFIREEFVEGKNLTDWKKLEQEGHNMKEIVSLLVRNVYEQIRMGQVHSDIHPGNFRVTPDKQLAILDRNFYLNLSPEIQTFVTSLPNPLISPNEKLNSFFSVFGVGLPQEAKERIEQTFDKTLEEVSSGNWSSMMNFLVYLREEGVKLPLEVTLIFKNFNVLQGLAHQAGFDSLVEAFFYSPES